MSAELHIESVPRLALRPPEAAQSLGVSEDHFTSHIAHELKWIRRGRLKLVPTDELREWARRNAERIEAGR
jgi:hypothetical protein